MRVITGTARSTPLKAPKGLETRPTLDQVKEGLFSAIQFDVPGARALDPTLEDVYLYVFRDEVVPLS